MRTPGTASQLEKRRLRAIELFEKDVYTQIEIAHKVKVHPRTIRRWIKSYREEGIDGLKPLPGQGKPPKKLSDKEFSKLEKILLKGALAAGFPTDLWTCPRIVEVIKEEFGVTYHPDHMTRVLRGLGWSPQKPTRRAIEKDEKQIKNWTKKDWSKIKKKQKS